MLRWKLYWFWRAIIIEWWRKSWKKAAWIINIVIILDITMTVLVIIVDNYWRRRVLWYYWRVIIIIVIINVIMCYWRPSCYYCIEGRPSIDNDEWPYYWQCGQLMTLCGQLLLLLWLLTMRKRSPLTNIDPMCYWQWKAVALKGR